MDSFFEGGSFVLEISNSNIKTESDIFNLLDTICTNEKLNPLNENWNKLSYEDCKELLLNTLNFDLAFTICESMTRDKAIYFLNHILSFINKDECRCFTNSYGNPWKSAQYSFNSITESTFDMAIIFLDSNKLVFTYKTGED